MLMAVIMVMIVFTVVPRRELQVVKAIICSVDSKLFFSVDEIQQASEGIFPRGRIKVSPTDSVPLRRAA